MRADEAERAVRAMCVQMAARGPDDEGVERRSAGDQVVVVGSRRLAIIDPSPAGHQPMSDEARGTTLVFNGMIYNFEDLRTRLLAEGETFASSCDTEVVLKAYGRYGVDCVRHLRGMFAFAIWDERERRLVLARDRLGIKPLYYRQSGDSFLFASQVKALLATGLVEPRLSVPGIQTFLAYGAVSDPLTAVEGVAALPAGHVAVLSGDRLDVSRYWEPPRSGDGDATRDEAAAELRARLEDVVRRHLVSDVALGVFLSGGIDSSVLAALAARETPHVRTVSVGFDDPALSEETYSDAVAAHVGSDHVRVRLHPDDLRASLPDSFAAMDQPSFDGINTYVVSRAAAATGLKVALSGLGGDELFDGYGHVSRVVALERARRLPAPVTRVAAVAAGAALPVSQRAKASEWLRSRPERGSSYELLRRLFFAREVPALCRGADANGALPHPGRVDLGGDVYTQVSGLDLTNYTKNVLLRDTDAMSMANSLEVRVPFLDDVLVDWVLRLPRHAKAGKAKALLVESVRDLLPPETLARRKQGFVLPLARWMRGELREDVDATLRRLPAPLEGVLDGRAVAGLWESYLRDGGSWLRPWSLYSLCKWASTLEPARATRA